MKTFAMLAVLSLMAGSAFGAIGDEYHIQANQATITGLGTHNDAWSDLDGGGSGNTGETTVTWPVGEVPAGLYKVEARWRLHNWHDNQSTFAYRLLGTGLTENGTAWAGQWHTANPDQNTSPSGSGPWYLDEIAGPTQGAGISEFDNDGDPNPPSLWNHDGRNGTSVTLAANAQVVLNFLDNNGANYASPHFHKLVFTEIPEPATLLLVGAGFAGAMFRRRR